MSVMSREKLFSSIRGNKATIPDLRQLMPHWTTGINPNLGRLREEINRWLKGIYSTDQTTYEKFKKADIGLFAAAWWPNAEWDELRIAAIFCAWVFVWDEEFDNGLYEHDLNKAEAYRNDTIQFIRQCLLSDAAGQPATHPDAVIESYRTISDAVRTFYDKQRLEMLFREVSFYIQSVASEQEFSLRKDLPTMKEYWSYRMGICAVRMALALNEYVGQSSIPLHLLQDPDMDTLWNQVTIQIWLVNDLVSVRKEVREQHASLIPLLFAASDDLQAAVDSAVCAMKTAVETFDNLATQLLSKCKNSQESAALGVFLGICRMNCTGNLNWSLQSPRYGMQKALGTWGGHVLEL